MYRASGQIVPAVMQPPPSHLSYLLPEKNWEGGGKEGAVGEAEVGLKWEGGGQLIWLNKANESLLLFLKLLNSFIDFW